MIIISGMMVIRHEVIYMLNNVFRLDTPANSCPNPHRLPRSLVLTFPAILYKMYWHSVLFSGYSVILFSHIYYLPGHTVTDVCFQVLCTHPKLYISNNKVPHSARMMKSHKIYYMALYNKKPTVCLVCLQFVPYVHIETVLFYQLLAQLTVNNAQDALLD